MSTTIIYGSYCDETSLKSESTLSRLLAINTACMPILYHIGTLPVLLEDCPSLLLSLTTCVMYMYYIGRLSLSGYNIVLLRWSPGVFFAVPPLTFVISAAHAVSVLAARRVLRSAARG